MSNYLLDSLHKGAEKLGLALSESNAEKLIDYLQLLAKWNRVYNLTAVYNESEMISRHLLDSLSIVPYIQAKRVIDVGAGAGLPGIPLAILSPETTVHLLDSNSKKTRFMQQAKGELGLDNVTVWHHRVEELQPEELYDGLVCRAFASLDKIQELAGHLVKPGGTIYAMKGLFSEQELSAVRKPFKVDDCIELRVPGTDGQRHLVVLKKD